ncbi:MAG: hypothetical protein JSC188_000411 [Candidatus Tokpelaia sp. JSC188]|nr:MAG: hypothetical protein JSC188_000411 [Candidatus Tokpelaia sp. JSC188]
MICTFLDSMGTTLLLNEIERPALEEEMLLYCYF